MDAVVRWQNALGDNQMEIYFQTSEYKAHMHLTTSVWYAGISCDKVILIFALAIIFLARDSSLTPTAFDCLRPADIKNKLGTMAGLAMILR